VAGSARSQPPASPKPITLRFAIPNGQGLPRIDLYVQEFVTQVHALSQSRNEHHRRNQLDAGAGRVLERTPVIHVANCPILAEIYKSQRQIDD